MGDVKDFSFLLLALLARSHSLSLSIPLIQPHHLCRFFVPSLCLSPFAPTEKRSKKNLKEKVIKVVNVCGRVENGEEETFT